VLEFMFVWIWFGLCSSSRGGMMDRLLLVILVLLVVVVVLVNGRRGKAKDSSARRSKTKMRHLIPNNSIQRVRWSWSIYLPLSNLICSIHKQGDACTSFMCYRFRLLVACCVQI
jgi:hypothetical protein